MQQPNVIVFVSVRCGNHKPDGFATAAEKSRSYASPRRLIRNMISLNHDANPQRHVRFCLKCTALVEKKSCEFRMPYWPANGAADHPGGFAAALHRFRLGRTIEKKAVKNGEFPLWLSEAGALLT